jgi:hypothetical protein
MARGVVTQVNQQNQAAASITRISICINFFGSDQCLGSS